MDPATGLTIFGTAVGSAKIVEKLLGPTADYLGAGLRSWTEKRVENTKRIFVHATKLLGDRIDAPGAVPPKVLKGILEVGLSVMTNSQRNTSVASSHPRALEFRVTTAVRHLLRC